MRFFTFFEKPKPSVAFSFDNGYVRWVSAIREENGIQINEYGSEFFGPDIISEYDAIVDDGAFVRKLRAINKGEKEKPKFELVNIVIPDRQAIMFHTHVAKMPEKEMDDVIVDHIKTYCESHDLLDVKSYICEYDVILKTDYGYDVHVTLVPKLYVEHVVRLFKQAGISVRYIETAHHAVAKSCLEVMPESGYVLVSFGNKETTVALLHGEHLVSQGTVAVGIENLYATIERFLGVGRDDSKRIINKHGILQTHPDNGLLSELYLELAPIYRMIDNQLIAIGTMPYKTFGHRFTTHDVIVYGEGVSVKGLVGFIGERTNLNAQELDPWAGHSEDRAPILNLPASETLIYAEPLSLALLYLVK
jgi:Tfp pilus assembly PilM family ATPase